MALCYVAPTNLAGISVQQVLELPSLASCAETETEEACTQFLQLAQADVVLALQAALPVHVSACI